MDVQEIMNKIGKHLLFCLGLGLLSSCTENNENPLGEYQSVNMQIDVEHDTKPLNLSQYTIDSVRSLTFPDTSKQVAVTRFMVKNDRIYVMDSEISQSIYVFDSQGNYLSKLGERGRAQDEYIGGPTNFFVDDSSNVHVFDEMGQQIKVFNRKCKFRSNFSTRHEMPHSIGLLNNNRYVYCLSSIDTETPQLMTVDLNGGNPKTLIPHKQHYWYNPSEITFFSNGSRLSHIPIMSDSVLVFNGDLLEKVVHFDFGGKFLLNEEPDILLTHDLEKFKKIKEYKGVWSLEQYQETDSYSLLVYIYQSYVKTWLYNKRTNKVIQGNQLFDGVYPYRTVYYLKDNQIIALVEREDVDLYKENYKNPTDEFKKNLAKSPSQIRDLLEGKIKTPALFYISLK